MKMWPKWAGRMNTKTRQIKKGSRENNIEMIIILSKDVECQLGMLIVERGEIIKSKHTNV